MNSSGWGHYLDTIFDRMRRESVPLYVEEEPSTPVHTAEPQLPSAPMEEITRRYVYSYKLENQPGVITAGTCLSPADSVEGVTNELKARGWNPVKVERVSK